MIFVFFCSLLRAIVPKFPNIFVHDNCTVSSLCTDLEKCYSHWASEYRVKVGLSQPIRLQEVL